MTSAPPPYQPPYQPPVEPGKAKLRGRIPLRLAAVFGVIGLALVIVGGVLLAKGSLSKIDGFTRVRITGDAQTVHLTRTGKYVGYYETPTDAPHTAYLQMRMADSSGTAVDLHLYGRNGASTSSLTYDDGDRHGEAFVTFTIAKAGDYQVLVSSTSNTSGARMAFGESIAKSLVAGVATIVPGVLLIVGAIILLIVGLVRRSGHKKQLRNFQGGPPPGPGYGGYGGGYGQAPPPPGGWPPPTQPQQ